MKGQERGGGREREKFMRGEKWEEVQEEGEINARDTKTRVKGWKTNTKEIRKESEDNKREKERES